MIALSKIIVTSKNKEEVREAKSIQKRIGTFEFVIMVVIQSFILETINIVSQLLQAKNIDLIYACSLLKNASEKLCSYRNQYDEIKDTACALAQTWGVEAKFQNKRQGRTRNRLDAILEDHRLSDPERHFQIAVFYANIDVITSQLKNRFQGMESVANRFNFLSAKALMSATDDELFSAAESFHSIYQDDLTDDFPSQMLCFRNVIQDQLKDLTIPNSMLELAELLIIKNNAISSNIPDVVTAYLLFLTIPVTVATAERSFSKLKIIKNYLRSSMSQERLRGLSILSVECEQARKINTQAIINEFAAKNVRRQSRFLK